MKIMDVGATAVFWTECQWSMEVGTGSLGLVGSSPRAENEGNPKTCRQRTGWEGVVRAF